MRPARPRSPTNSWRLSHAPGGLVIRASIDGFHHLADVRYRRGRLSLERYVPGRRPYLAEAQPERHDSVVVDNNDVADPRLGGL
jgi:hypothetical protein